MNEITRVGVDLAKRVIQVHAVRADGKVVFNRSLPREKFVAWCALLPRGCLVAFETCSGAHHWARLLRDMGQQAILSVHRLREGLKEERTACINRIRGLLAEFGLVFAQFKKASQFGAWLGLVPRQNSSGGKASLGSITQRGDDYLRTLLIQGAKAAVRTSEKRSDRLSQWVTQLKARVGWQKAVVALANKNARILWAILTRGERFDANHLSDKPEPPRQLTPTPPCPA